MDNQSMQPHVSIKADQITTYSKKRRLGLRLVVFSVLIGLLAIATGFNQYLIAGYGVTTILDIVAGIVGSLTPLGIIAGLIVWASAKKPLISGPLPSSVPPAPTVPVDMPVQPQIDAATLRTIQSQNTTKLIAAIACFSVPVLFIVVGGFFSLFALLGAGDDTNAGPSPFGIFVVLFLIGLNIFIPAVIAGVILLIRRRKVIITNATN